MIISCRSLVIVDDESVHVIPKTISEHLWPKITDLGTSPTLAFFGWVVTVVVIFRHYLYSTCLHPNIWVTYITICIQLPGSMLNIRRTSMEPPSATATTHFKSSYHKNNNKKEFQQILPDNEARRQCLKLIAFQFLWNELVRLRLIIIIIVIVVFAKFKRVAWCMKSHQQAPAYGLSS